MMKKQLYTFVVVIVLGFTSHVSAAASSTQKIILPKIAPADAFIYYARKMNAADYADYNVSTLAASARLTLIANFEIHKKKITVEGLRKTFAVQPEANQSFFELSKLVYSRDLPWVLNDASKECGRSVKELLESPGMIDRVMRILTPSAIMDKQYFIKQYCIIRALQYIYNAPMNDADFERMKQDAQEICDICIDAACAGEATVKLQERNPALDEIWAQVPEPTPAE